MYVTVGRLACGCQQEALLRAPMQSQLRDVIENPWGHIPFFQAVACSISGKLATYQPQLNAPHPLSWSGIYSGIKQIN